MTCAHTHTECEQWLTTFWSWNTCWSHGSNVSWRLNIYCRFLQSHDLDNNHCTEHTPGSCWQRRMQRCWRGGREKLGNKYTHQQDNKPTKTNSVWIRTFKGLTDFQPCYKMHFGVLLLPVFLEVDSHFSSVCHFTLCVFCSSSLWRLFSPFSVGCCSALCRLAATLTLCSGDASVWGLQQQISTLRPKIWGWGSGCRMRADRPPENDCWLQMGWKTLPKTTRAVREAVKPQDETHPDESHPDAKQARKLAQNQLNTDK